MTDRYAVIGHPIAHSKSPLIHGLFARATGQGLHYGLIEGSLDGFDATVQAFRMGGGRGLSVSAPFKRQALALADRPSKRARKAGAVNALKFEDGHVAADNFDGSGLLQDIQVNLGLRLRGKRVLMLGAGGAAHGLLLPILEQRPAALVVANRTPEKAVQLVAEAGPRAALRASSYAALGDDRPFDVVINATSASLRGELPPVSPLVFGVDCLAYELVYGKGLTPFLRLAQNAGVRRLADGVGMLVEQAAEAFQWWRGVRPPTADVIRAMSVPLD